MPSSSSSADLASACDDGMRVVDGVCRRVPQATFMTEIVTNRLPQIVQKTGFDGVSISAPNGQLEAPVFATIGTCKLHKKLVAEAAAPEPTDLVTGDWGTVTRTSPSGATFAYRPTGQTMPAYSGSTPPNLPVFNGGETMSLTTTGSAQFPAWQVSLRMPLPLVLNEPKALVRGQPFEVSWGNVDTGSSMIVIVATKNDAESVGATCEIPDTGAFTVPSAVTSLLHEERAVLITYRKRAITNEPADANVILEWDAFARDGFSLRP